MKRYLVLTLALLSLPSNGYRIAYHKIMRAPVNANQSALDQQCTSYSSIDHAVTQLSLLNQDATWNNRIETEIDFLITTLGTNLNLDTRLVAAYLASFSPAAQAWANNHLTNVDQSTKNALLTQLLSVYTGSNVALGVASWLVASGAQPQSIPSVGTLSLVIDTTYHRLLVEDAADHGIKAIILGVDPVVSGIMINPNQRMFVYYSDGALLKLITFDADGHIVQEAALATGTPNQLSVL